MKATGIYRRIDNLGRIVLPKEIRNNYKINDGDNIEIFVDNDSIILKKYSIIDNITDLSKKLVTCFYKIYNKKMMITDNEKIITMDNIELDNSIKKIINNRKDIYLKNSLITKDNNKYNFYISPIIYNSDTIGSIILVSDNISEEEIRVVSFLNLFLIKNIEE